MGVVNGFRHGRPAGNSWIFAQAAASSRSCHACAGSSKEGCLGIQSLHDAATPRQKACRRHRHTGTALFPNCGVRLRLPGNVWRRRASKQRRVRGTALPPSGRRHKSRPVPGALPAWTAILGRCLCPGDGCGFCRCLRCDRACGHAGHAIGDANWHRPLPQHLTSPRHPQLLFPHLTACLP